MESMTNEEVFAEMMEISSLMHKLSKERKWQERNRLTPRWRELYNAYDFNFSVNEQVLIKEGRGNVLGKIKDYIEEENAFLVKKDSGGECIYPGTLLIKIGLTEQGDVIVPLEQLSLLSS